MPRFICELTDMNRPKVECVLVQAPSHEGQHRSPGEWPEMTPLPMASSPEKFQISKTAAGSFTEMPSGRPN